jgi:RHS repeat-associated protein
MFRFQFSNNIDSACLETDEVGGVISYEEYYPYGGSSFRAGKVNKRYRFSGKERDEETGFYYFGARYYVPWIARWVSCDPKGFPTAIDAEKHDKRPQDFEQRLNPYLGIHDNSTSFVDPDGRDPIKHGAVVAARALAKRFFREMGERGARLAARRISRVVLRELAEGLLPKVEKHIMEHTEQVLEKVTHTLFKSGTTKEGILTLIKDTVKTGGHAVLSQSENGGLVA